MPNQAEQTPRECTTLNLEKYFAWHFRKDLLTRESGPFKFHYNRVQFSLYPRQARLVITSAPSHASHELRKTIDDLINMAEQHGLCSVEYSHLVFSVMRSLFRLPIPEKSKHR